ncbi:hypothetical protein PAXRUDRAFT_28292 [Paxillus rubicundulus Ve08.2h10]|uniref:Uncharacterized protein n=1 Tax=Paxillus rubicundulus Ve08.2h10 TaxID=930991 RepID=A0A0D0D8C3_9AGAM|nr:hypothetical protein PAXRUDRAFT_28292 [Paxillus rubicundulus Ve08.2h10]
MIRFIGVSMQGVILLRLIHHSTGLDQRSLAQNMKMVILIQVVMKFQWGPGEDEVEVDGASGCEKMRLCGLGVGTPYARDPVAEGANGTGVCDGEFKLTFVGCAGPGKAASS